MWRRAIPPVRSSFQTSIAVRGQEEEIAKVSYAKVIFDIGKNTKETVTADLDYQFYDEDGQVLNLSGIHAEAGQIQATLPVYVTKELKLTVDFKGSRRTAGGHDLGHQAGERCGFR